MDGGMMDAVHLSPFTVTTIVNLSSVFGGESGAKGIGRQSPQGCEDVPSPGCSAEPSIAYGPPDRIRPSDVGALLAKWSCTPATGPCALRAALGLGSHPLVSHRRISASVSRPLVRRKDQKTLERLGPKIYLGAQAGGVLSSHRQVAAATGVGASNSGPQNIAQIAVARKRDAGPWLDGMAQEGDGLHAA